jgi:hypothetical protein
MNFLKQLWLSVRSNPYFVAAYSAAGGAVVDLLYDELQTGQMDFSRAGIHKLLTAAGGAVLVALMHLYRPAPQVAASKK